MGSHWPGPGFQNLVSNYLLGFHSLTHPNKLLIFHDDYSPHTWICSSLEFLISLNDPPTMFPQSLPIIKPIDSTSPLKKSQTYPLVSHSVVPLSPHHDCLSSGQPQHLSMLPLYFFFFSILSVLCCMWDGSLTRDRMQGICSETTKS